MFNLKLSHLNKILPEGHNTPALETDEFYEENTEQFIKNVLHTKKPVQNGFESIMHGRTNLSSQTLRACQISAGTAAGVPLPEECPCSSAEPYPKPC